MKVWFKFLFISDTVGCDAGFKNTGFVAKIYMYINEKGLPYLDIKL